MVRPHQPINAYVLPVVREYVKNLERGLAALGFERPWLVMQSNGGVLPARAAAEQPARMFLSGPAAGVSGAAFLARHCGLGDVVTMDVGGTSCDVSLGTGGEPQMTTRGLSEYRIDGQPLNLLMMDIVTLGAGGGSVVRADAGGMLRVGPESAGADPGPACYGRGGEAFTLTDAMLLLGLVPAERFNGGRFAVDPALAARAAAALCDRFEMTPVGLAESAYRIAVANIAQALRLATVERGRDPRDYAICAYGGGGPLFAAAVAEAAGMRAVRVPPNPGIFSAYGLSVADVQMDFVRCEPGTAVASVSARDIRERFDALAAKSRSELERVGVASDDLRLERIVDARYVGQGFELRVGVDLDTLEAEGADHVADGFHAAHARAYGHAFREQPVEIVNYRLVARVPRAHAPPTAPAGTATPRREAHTVHLGGTREWSVIPREDLGEGASVAGPALVVEDTSTTQIPPGWTAAVDRFGTLHLVEEE